MHLTATALGLACVGTGSYLLLWSAGVDENFAGPYAVIACALVAVSSTHFIQKGSAFMNNPIAAAKGLAVGIPVTLVNFMADAILGGHRASVAGWLASAQGAGIAFLITLAVGWVWIGTCFVGLVRSLLLRFFGRRTSGIKPEQGTPPE